MENVEEKEYTFTRKIEGTEWGVVTATSKEEAIEKLMKGDEDDVIEQSAYFTGKQEDIISLEE